MKITLALMVALVIMLSIAPTPAPAAALRWDCNLEKLGKSAICYVCFDDFGYFAYRDCGMLSDPM